MRRNTATDVIIEDTVEDEPRDLHDRKKETVISQSSYVQVPAMTTLMPSRTVVRIGVWGESWSSVVEDALYEIAEGDDEAREVLGAWIYGICLVKSRLSRVYHVLTRLKIAVAH